MPINYSLIGRRIKEMRTSKRITQAVLAEAIDMSVQYISLIESGKKQVSLNALVRIAGVLEVTVNDLLLGNQDLSAKEYSRETDYLFRDCSEYERKVILEVAMAVKKSLRDHSGGQAHPDQNNTFLHIK
jgi:transcriptional regulator with XRE-family HTH domain